MYFTFDDSREAEKVLEAIRMTAGLTYHWVGSKLVVSAEESICFYFLGANHARLLLGKMFDDRIKRTKL